MEINATLNYWNILQEKVNKGRDAGLHSVVVAFISCFGITEWRTGYFEEWGEALIWAEQMHKTYRDIGYAHKVYIDGHEENFSFQDARQHRED